MINSFFVSLVNRTTPPAVPGALAPLPIWPSNLLLLPNSQLEAQLDAVLFPVSLNRTAMAIMWLWLVEASTVADLISLEDERRTYDRAQLRAVMHGVDRTAYRNAVTVAMGAIPPYASEVFTSDVYRKLYENAMTELDRTAVLVCHFGLRSERARS